MYASLGLYEFEMNIYEQDAWQVRKGAGGNGYYFFK